MTPDRGRGPEARRSLAGATSTMTRSLTLELGLALGRLAAWES
jgi:hypothetical protein